jgi:hypothetical protein
MDVPAKLAELTRAREVIAATEAAAAWDSVTLHVKDVEGWSSLAEREVLEWVSRAEAENTTALASTHEDTEGLSRMVTLLED